MRSVARVESIKQIHSADRRFWFRNAIQVEAHQEQGHWILECRPLYLVGYGKTKEESRRSFVEAFECQWDSIAQERDSKLTAEALDLKRTLLEL